MRLSELRAILSDIEIEDDPYCVGYWLRWAGQSRPRKAEQQEGWDQANEEIAWERTHGSSIIGASVPIDWYRRSVTRQARAPEEG